MERRLNDHWEGMGSFEGVTYLVTFAWLPGERKASVRRKKDQRFVGQITWRDSVPSYATADNAADADEDKRVLVGLAGALAAEAHSTTRSGS